MDLIFAVLGAIGVHFLATELYARGPRSARFLIGCAVRRLPLHLRKRYGEEWLAHIDECDGTFSKLAHGIECLVCARKVALANEQNWSIDVNGTIIQADAGTALFLAKSFGKIMKDETNPEKTTLVEMVEDLEGLGISGRPDKATIAEFAAAMQRAFAERPKTSVQVTIRGMVNSEDHDMPLAE